MPPLYSSNAPIDRTHSRQHYQSSTNDQNSSAQNTNSLSRRTDEQGRRRYPISGTRPDASRVEISEAPMLAMAQATAMGVEQTVNWANVHNASTETDNDGPCCTGIYKAYGECKWWQSSKMLQTVA